jgi:hypothetical protein
MRVCGAKNTMFPIKIAKMFKVETIYKYVTCKSFIFHVNTYLLSQTPNEMSLGVTPPLLVGTHTIADH